MMEEDNKGITFNIYGGNNQILPTAQQAIQYNYYGDSAIKLDPRDSKITSNRLDNVGRRR